MVINLSNEHEFITTPELCSWLKVSKSTISRWRNEGLPHYGKTRAYRYKKNEVISWLDEQEKKQK